MATVMGDIGPAPGLVERDFALGLGELIEPNSRRGCCPSDTSCVNQFGRSR